MAIVIKVKITDKIRYNNFLCLTALAKAGYHGLYFSIDEISGISKIVIDNPDIKFIPTLASNFQQLFSIEQLPVTIEAVSEDSFTPTSEFESFLHMMTIILSSSRHKEGLLADIQYAAIRSAEVIPDLTKKLHLNWEKSHKPKVKTVSRDPWDDFGMTMDSAFSASSSSHYQDSLHTQHHGFGGYSYTSPFEASSSSSHDLPHSFFGTSQHSKSHTHDPFGMSDQKKRIQEQNERLLRESKERDRQLIAKQNADIARRQIEERNRIQHQNDTLSFNFESRAHSEMSQKTAHIKAERNLCAAMSLGLATSTNKWSSTEIAANWKKFFIDSDFVSEITSKVETGDEDLVKLHIDIKKGTISGTNENYTDNYYTTVQCFYEQLGSILEGNYAATLRYNPPKCDSFDIDYRIKMNDNSMTCFIFDIQLALISTGLLNQFIIQVINCHSIQSVKPVIIDHMKPTPSTATLTIADIMKRYNIVSTEGPSTLKNEQIERMTRMAAANNLIDDLKLLVVSFKSLNINNQDSNPTSRKTPLHLAVERGHLKIVKYLLASGARIDIADAKAKTVNDLSEMSQYPEIAFAIQKQKTIDLMRSFSSISMKR